MCLNGVKIKPDLFHSWNNWRKPQGTWQFTTWFTNLNYRSLLAQHFENYQAVSKLNLDHRLLPSKISFNFDQMTLAVPQTKSLYKSSTREYIGDIKNKLTTSFRTYSDWGLKFRIVGFKTVERWCLFQKIQAH